MATPITSSTRIGSCRGGAPPDGDRGVCGPRRARPHGVCTINRLPSVLAARAMSLTNRQGGEVWTACGAVPARRPFGHQRGLGGVHSGAVEVGLNSKELECGKSRHCSLL